MTFPRNPIDNSLDMVAFVALNDQDQEAAIQDLEDNGTDIEVDFFFEQIKILKQQNLQNLKQHQEELSPLQDKHANLEEQKKIYTAAYNKDMQSTLDGVSNNSTPNVTTQNAHSKKSVKKSNGCNLF